MAQQQNQGQGPATGDNSLDFLWLIVILVLIVVLVWYFFRVQITSFIFVIRLYEIKAINFILQPIIDLLFKSNLPTPNLSDLHHWSAYIQQRPADVPFTTVTEVSETVGRYLRYPAMIILAFLGILIYRKHVVLKFKTIFSMATLKKAEQENWPQIRPTMKLNLVEKDLDEGKWAMSKTPLFFCEHHNIIEAFEEDGRKTAKLIKGAAYRVFALQTGRLWTGVEHQPIHVKALLAIFAARANHDTKASDELLDQISASTGRVGRLNFAGVQTLLKKYVNTEVVRRVVARHAYVLTVMPTMLELARTDGVLASADFLWLKPLDRPLWYILNTIGRRTAVPEVAGAYAHWLAEKELGCAIRTPMVDEAIRGMELILSETLYDPEGDK